jgi:hypothetical protein
MKNEDLLTDFIDGNLDYRMEKKFCSYIRSDDELRSTLKQFCAIGIATQQASDFVPSKESTEKLYSTLGFKHRRRKPFGFFKFPNMDKAPSFFAGFLTSLIITGASLLMINPDIFAGKQGSAGQQNYATTSGIVSQPPVSSSSSGKGDNSNTKVVFKTDTVYRKILIAMKPDTVYIERRFVEESSLLTTRVTTEKTPELKSPKQDYSFLNQSEEKKNNFLIDYYEPIGLSVEFRGSSYWNLPYTYIQPDKYMNFKNTSLAVFYNLADDFKIGAEVRQETFYQQFEDSVFLYEQQPNFFTGGLSFRYMPFDFGKFYPFIQGTIGYNSAGLVARPMVGFEFRPYPDINFMLGFEYSYLYYKQGNRNFGANKLGLNYGMSYCF